MSNKLTVYVTGGGGTHLEPRVTSHYLTAMISEAGARGALGTVTAVKTQQSEIDSPLDDLVIEGRLPDGTGTRLDLQITTTLSFTDSDDKWNDIVPRAWDSFRRSGFNPATDRIGIAVSQTTTKLERSVQPLLARARHAADGSQYRKRLAAHKGSNSDQREFQRVLDDLVKTKDPAATDDEIVDFLRCLTIVAFDLDQEDASRDRLAAIDQLTPVVGGVAEAKQVWSMLTAMASRIIPSGGGADRATVVRELQFEGHTIGSDRSHAELVAALDAESRLATASIRDTIGGITINRDELRGAVADALAENRLLRIVGQHGAGKSAMLKRIALEEPAGAPILFLRDLRVTGGGWAAHVAKFGKAMSLSSLLREFGLCGSHTLFIDGVDKMDAGVQVTINDLLKAIADTTDLGNWRVVMTMREENAQRVDGWLDPVAVSKLSSKTLRVEGFDDEEAAEAARALPLLRPLLADSRNYDTVLRRPFFLDALSRLPVAPGGDVHSEIDLVELWWEHGGADGVDFAPAQGRRNVLLTLGEQLFAKPAHAMTIRSIDPVALDEMLRSGVLRSVELGISVAFSHDIYEEWILERVLRQQRGEIAEALRAGGEDLQLARPLQLLAAFLLERYENGNEWSNLLAAVGEENLGAVWSRVVLTAPVRSVHSSEMLDKIAPELLRDDGRLLERLIDSVRTTETVRDLRFLDEAQVPDLSIEQREQYASEGAGPEIVSWLRLVKWLVPRLGSMPARVNDELLAFFDSWVPALPPPLARFAHVPEIADWAREQLGSTDSSHDQPTRYWERSREDLDRVRVLLLKSAGAAPEVVRDYLGDVSTQAMRHVRNHVVTLSLILVNALPAEMVAFLLRAYLIDHERSADGTRHLIYERSRIFGFDGERDFYPPSPIRPPFLLLLRANPVLGLELIRKICNHAMEGWRRSQPAAGGEQPIPITVDFGEGSREFWGDGVTYRWFRGGPHVHIVSTALMALEAWAHGRLEAGDSLDDLCRAIVHDNECNAVLGICAGLCLADVGSAATSPVALAVGTHPALWQWDLMRQVDDMGPHANEIGHWAGAAPFANALRAHNQLPHRGRTVRDLAVVFAALAPDEVKATYAAAIDTFLDRVPFGTAEERGDPERAQALRDSFEPLRQQADPANLVVEERDGMMYVSIVPPYASSMDYQAALEEQGALNRVLRLYLWATKAVEDGTPSPEIGLQEALGEMVALDSADLFDVAAPIADMAHHNAQSAVSATAAVLARHAESGLWASAETNVVSITQRAATMAEEDGGFSFRGTHLTGHPPAMAAHAYAALLRRDPARHEWRVALLQLAVDPMEKVVEAVYDAGGIFADAAPDMVWRLFCLATQRAARTQAAELGVHWSRAEADEQSAFADEAERLIADGVLPGVHPTPSDMRGQDSMYHWDFHANAFRLPLEPMLHSTTRDALIAHAGSAIELSLTALGKEGERDAPSHEWLNGCGKWLGRLLGLISPNEVDALLLRRLDVAESSSAAEVMELVISEFMLQWMIHDEPLEATTIEIWKALVDWSIARPSWHSNPLDARPHDRSMAISAFFCAVVKGIVCGVDTHWPNLGAVLPTLNRAADAFSTERSAFAAMLALLRTGPEGLLPQPGLNWIKRVVDFRKANREFWSHASNGERLVLLLRELVSAGTVSASEREIVVRVADTLIEAGVKGAAFLQQDLVKSKRQG